MADKMKDANYKSESIDDAIKNSVETDDKDYTKILREVDITLYKKNGEQTNAGMLITLRDELYGGSWEKMAKALNARLNERPYIFKIPNLIKKDLKVIERMKTFEEKEKVNLRDVLKRLEKKYTN